MDNKRVLEVGNEMFNRRMNGDTIHCSNGVEIDVKPLTEQEQIYVSSQTNSTAMAYAAFMLGVTDIRGLEDESGNPVKVSKGRRPNPLGRGAFVVIDDAIRDRLPAIVKIRVSEVVMELSGMSEEDVSKVNFTSRLSETSS